MAFLAIALMFAVTPQGRGQGMSPEARQNIHALVNGHDQIDRVLTLTENGYEAVTRSTNSVIAGVLRDHVRQMQDRLDKGLAARRWDPAFAKYRAYYDQIDVRVEAVEGGVRVVAEGRTPEAAKVARNHARVINEFVSDGWTAHDSLHPAALNSTDSVSQTALPTRDCGRTGSGNCRGGCGSASIKR